MAVKKTLSSYLSYFEGLVNRIGNSNEIMNQSQACFTQKVVRLVQNLFKRHIT